MKKTILFASILLLFGCMSRKPEGMPGSAAFSDRHLKNVTRLTFDGDNGEAYFSRDGKKLIFQSSRGGCACDKIWTMNLDGSDKRMVSPTERSSSGPRTGTRGSRARRTSSLPIGKNESPADRREVL